MFYSIGLESLLRLNAPLDFYCEWMLFLSTILVPVASGLGEIFSPKSKTMDKFVKNFIINKSLYSFKPRFNLDFGIIFTPSVCFD